MKKILLILFLMLLVATPIYSQTEPDLLKINITLDRREATVSSMLEEMSNKYSLVFSYEPTEIDLSRMVRLSKNSLVLSNLLKEMFRNTDIVFTIHAKVIILRKYKKDTSNKKKISISGILKDANSGESIVGSTVYDPETKSYEVANQYGFYSLTVPEGKNKIQFSCIGYETRVLDTLFLNNTRLDIELYPKSIELNEVVVTDKQTRMTDFTQGFSRIDLLSVKTLPSLFGETDLVKNVLLLPGVNSTSELGGNLQVRGGSWDQNLMLLDEAIVYNSNHLFGLFSTYNPDIIKDVKFYKGNIPASYGGRISSVMDVTQKEGNMKSYHLDGGIGIISGKLTLEGPIVKDKSSFILAVRRSLFEPYMKYVNNENAKDLRPYFFDLNMKINYIVNHRNRLYLSCYTGYDQLNIIHSEDQNYGNITSTLRVNHIFHDKLFSNTSFIFSKYNMSVNKTSDEYRWKAKFGLEHYEFKTDFTAILPSHKIKFGVQSIYYTFHPGEQIPMDESSILAKTKVADDHSIESAFFIHDQIKVSEPLELQVGFRLSNYNCLGKADIYRYIEGEPRSNVYIFDTLHYGNGKVFQTYNHVEPRITLKYLIHDCQTIVVSYNKMIQYVQLITRTFSPQPYDMWKPADRYIKPLLADVYSIGYFIQFKNKGLDFSIESFYKSIENVIEVKAGTEILFNPNIDAGIVQGNGKAYGLEFSAGKTKGNFTGTISYTWSRSFRKVDSKFLEEKINLGNSYPTDYDIPHKFNLNATYEVSKRVSFTANFIFQSGRPVSYPSGQFYYMNNLMAYYSGKNQFRYNVFHHLDLGAVLKNKPKPNRKWESYWALSVYNVYNRENEYYNGIRYSNNGTKNTQVVSIWIFNVVPSLSYNFKF